MTDADREINTMKGALHTYGDRSEDNFHVQSRGRPERNPRESALRNLRRKEFGKKMREMREAAGLSLSRAAALAGIASARKLSQYETTCYPPGDIIVRLAPFYGVKPRQLCSLVLSHSDPELYAGITGKEGYAPSDAEIEAYLKRPPENEASDAAGVETSDAV